MRFRNFIGLLPTGDRLSAEGERNPADSSVTTYPEYRYSGIRARFTGLEASGTVRLFGPGGLQPGGSAGALDLLQPAPIIVGQRHDRSFINRDRIGGHSPAGPIACPEQVCRTRRRHAVNRHTGRKLFQSADFRSWPGEPYPVHQSTRQVRPADPGQSRTGHPR